jgi:hypothetical protein
LLYLLFALVSFAFGSSQVSSFWDLSLCPCCLSSSSVAAKFTSHQIRSLQSACIGRSGFRLGTSNLSPSTQKSNDETEKNGTVGVFTFPGFSSAYLRLRLLRVVLFVFFFWFLAPLSPVSLHISSLPQLLHSKSKNNKTKTTTTGS